MNKKSDGSRCRINEKGVDKEIIFDALEAALASATRKKHGAGTRRARRHQPADRAYDTFRRWKVFSRRLQRARGSGARLRMDDARDIDKDVRWAANVEEPMESCPSAAFSRRPRNR